MLNMRSGSDRGDLTARAAILDAALRLFAARGEDATTVRAIAADADVSPALVLHHFGSKDGLRQAVVERLRNVMDEVFVASATDEAAAQVDAGEWGGVADLLIRAFPPGSPVLAYVRRLFLAGDPLATELLARWHAESVAITRRWEDAGRITPGPDIDARVALLMSADLGLLLLRDQWSSVLGADPLGEAMPRLAEEAMRTYSGLWDAASWDPGRASGDPPT